MISSGDMQAVSQFIKRLGQEIRAIIQTAQEISFYSKGAWDYYTVLNMSQAEREIAVEIINERIKIASKTQFPHLF